MIEMAHWAPRPGSDRRDGVREDAYPRDPRPTAPNFAPRDFARGHGWGFTESERRGAAGVAVLLTTARDERADWLRAGQALQWMLLRAAEDGISAAFHTQALEVPTLREFIRAQFYDGAHPQMIVRLGVADDEEPVSLRRTADEAMRPEP